MSTFQIGQYVRIQTEEADSAYNGTFGIIGEPVEVLIGVRVQGQLDAVPFQTSELTLITQEEADAIRAREVANGEIF